MPPAKDNALGFWEPQPIVDAHDRFLSQAGTGWEAIAEYPTEMFDSDAAAACRRSLSALIASEYGDAPFFIVKDPRISRLMPLWRPVLSELNIAPRIVITVRNPLEIAASLRTRNGWSEHRALLVWLRYMLAAERDTRDLIRSFVGYGQLMNGWRETVGRLSDQLGLNLSARGEALERRIEDFLRPDMHHHRHRADTLLRRADIADCVKQAWLCFSTAVETGSADQAALDRTAAALDHAQRKLDHMTHNAPGPLHAMNPMPAAAGDALTALMLAELEQANDIAEQSQRLVDQMRATWSWRFTKPLRALRRTAGGLAAKRD
jgi:hypothetical protein